jgi:hypothetical protein
MVERDDDLVVPYDAARVRGAPSVDADAALDEAEQDRLAQHYDVAATGAGGVRTTASGGAEMIRSEEEVVTGPTERRATERVRLRKVLVTEQVTKTVPVRREEIRLETDPPPEGTIERVEDVDE